MRTLLFSCLFLLSLGLGCSDSGSENQQPNKETAALVPVAAEIDPGAILAKAEKAFAALTNYHATLKVLMPGPKGEREIKGKVWYSGNRHHIDFPGDVMICDGKESMTWYKEFGEVVLEPYDEKKDMSLGGMYKLYKKQHSLEYVGEDKGLHKIKLEQTDQGGVFPSKTLWVNPGNNLIESYELFAENIGTYHYDVEGVQVNQEDLDEALFTIDKDFVEKVRNGEVPPQPHAEEDEDDHDGHEH